MSDMVEDVLFKRYASAEMKAIWSDQGKIILERELWIAVLRTQQIMLAPEGELNEETLAVIADYEAVIDEVDLDSIAERERRTKHDVLARIEEFNTLAGHQRIHEAMTSRDATDNVEQMQIRKALIIIQSRAISTLALIAAKAKEYSGLAMVGRSHNVPAQVVTLGKRLAMSGEEIYQAYRHLEELIDRYPMRGIQGPMGTAVDQVAFLGEIDLYQMFEEHMIEYFGTPETLNCVGQVYPRSLDFEVVACLEQLAAGASNLALNFRLMSGFDDINEGFKKGQKGSSAMPHKKNARTSERINGLKKILHGYTAMLSAISGDQWQEGDVSCSVVRRVALPGAFAAIDGLFSAVLTILAEFDVYPIMIERELERNLQFLATTKILVGAIKAGMGREDAYEIIQEHAKEAARAQLRGEDELSLYHLLGEDESFALNEEQIRALIGNPIEFAGMAERQVEQFCLVVGGLVSIAKHDGIDTKYRPAPIL